MSHFAALPAKLSSATLLALALGWPLAAGAQQSALPQVAVPVVQAVPQKSPGVRLNDALNRLARNPQDVAALGEAGQASLELGDGQAAIGFYRRALTLQPDNARLKAGLAGAYVLSEDPFSALELFDEAEKAGPIDPARLADRGLAFDLVGDSQTAQDYYRQSLAAAPSDETLRRMALSQAIRRDRKGMDLTLAPLLQKQDKAAWRTRAFGLAIIGQAEEAESIARQTMPTEMAEAITAYLRYMPRLTVAQQAAAGNLGRFPRASEIGTDDPRVAAYQRSHAQLAVATPAPAAPPAKGKGKRDARPPKVQPVRAVAAVPPPEPQVSRETSTASRPAVVAPKPAPVQVAAAPRPVVQSTLPPATAAATPPVAPPATPPAVTVSPAVTQQAATFDLAKANQAAPAAVAAPRKPASLDEAFADLAPPSNVAEPKAGAVDVRTVRPVALARKEPAPVMPVKEPAAKDAPAKPAAAKTAPAKAPAGKELTAKEKAAADKAAAGKDAKAKAADPKAKDPKAKDAKGKDAKGKPSHPSRIWVQIAAGRNKPALAFDWRKFAKEDPAVFKGQSPYVTPWGQTNRLLTGPFASAKAAEAYLAKVKKAGRDGAFVWTSPAGQAVDPLAADK